ncbi:MAG: hypothetical protein SOY46_05210 [Butyrivibrio crossotus]|nr:hypothetical protein [Butyrivibrio crossotus]
MEIVTDVENKIENKIEEGSQALTQLMDAMNDITDKSNRISAVNNIGEFTTNTQATSEECVAISQILNEQADNMRNAVNRFNI